MIWGKVVTSANTPPGSIKPGAEIITSNQAGEAVSVVQWKVTHLITVKRIPERYFYMAVYS